MFAFSRCSAGVCGSLRMPGSSMISRDTLVSYRISAVGDFLAIRTPGRLIDRITLVANPAAGGPTDFGDQRRTLGPETATLSPDLVRQSLRQASLAPAMHPCLPAALRQSRGFPGGSVRYVAEIR